jgi:predicted DsbA family dithiol-disulfide isomerase
MNRILTTICASALTLILLFATFIVALGQDGQRVLAEVNGRQIKESDVDALFPAQIMPLREQLYAVRKVALENLIITTLLELEAGSQKTSLEGLRKKLSEGSVQVTSDQIENAYTENLSALGAMSPDEAKERLRLDLEVRARIQLFRDALEELRRKARVEVFLEEPRLPRLQHDASTPMIGSSNAAVTIVEFADFECPYCRESQAVIKKVIDEYQSDVRLIFKHLPLDIHSQANTASRAAFCAGEQNLFWQYHDALFASRDLDPQGLGKIASRLGLSEPKFQFCLKSDASRDAIMRDKAEAARLGITSTPTFIVNGKLVRGVMDINAFRTLIGQELNAARNGSRSNESGSPDVRRKL